MNLSISKPYESEILIVEKVYKYLRIPLSSLYQLARNRKIPAFRVGRHRRFKKAKIEEWIEKQKEIR